MQQPELGKKIVELRKNLNLTQEELASRSSLGLRTIQRIETGGVMPRNSTVELLLKTLGVNRQSFEKFNWSDRLRNRFTHLFLLKKTTDQKLYPIIQTAWISGLFYFLTLIIENGMEYMLVVQNEFEITFIVSYILVKSWVLVAFGLFMRGFLVLSMVFENNLLRISTYIMFTVMMGVVFTDIIKISYTTNEDLVTAIMIGQSMVAGAASIMFGIALLGLQDSLGVLSKYSGVIEIIIGSCFTMVFLAPLALAFLVPATVLEIVILYKASLFIKSEAIT